MAFRRLGLALSAVVLGVLPVIACGSDRSGVTTAPSSALSIAPATAAVEPSVQWSSARISAADAPSNTITSLVAGTSCPTLQFKISTYLIKTDTATRYDGGSCATLRAGTKITLQVTRLGGDNEQTVYASQITIQQTTTPTPAPTPTPTPAQVRTDGTVTSVVSGTACPDLRFMFGANLFAISRATAYSQASCADVKVGVHVYVAGTKREGDTFVAVTGLGIERDGTPNPAPAPPTTPSPVPAPTPAPSSFETTVTVSSIVAGSACPYREFMVGGYRLITSAMTRYENGSCADIAPGAALGIVGTRGDRDTVVLVSSVTVKRDSEPEPPSEDLSTDVTVDSVVAGSVCPALSFLVGPYTVTVSSATRYEGGMCTGIKPGSLLRLIGTKQSDDHVLASLVSFPD